jgi:hypothetical protein
MKTRSPEKQQQRTCEEWAAEYHECGQKTVEGLIGQGKTLIKAKADLHHHGKWLPFLRNNLKIDIRFAQGLMKLARNPRFSNASNLTHLPHVVSVLAELARLSEEEFEAGKASGAINPSMTAEQARKLNTRKGSRADKSRPPPADESRPPVAARPPDPLIADLAAIEEKLCDRLDGGRLQRAIACLEEIRKLLTDNVVPMRPGLKGSSEAADSPD